MEGFLDVGRVEPPGHCVGQIAQLVPEERDVLPEHVRLFVLDVAHDVLALLGRLEPHLLFDHGHTFIRFDLDLNLLIFVDQPVGPGERRDRQLLDAAVLQAVAHDHPLEVQLVFLVDISAEPRDVFAALRLADEPQLALLLLGMQLEEPHEAQVELSSHLLFVFDLVFLSSVGLARAHWVVESDDMAHRHPALFVVL